MPRLSMREFKQVVRRVMETLPAVLLPHLDNVVVDVAVAPDRGTLRDVGLSDEEIDAGESVYGLFIPLDQPDMFGTDFVEQPHRIVIYKRPLEEDFPDRRQLMTEIRKTVVHELAHHFGYTDRDLERFDDNPDPFGGTGAEALE